MPRACVCPICRQHRARGSLLYTTSRTLQELSPMGQRREIALHKALDVCPHLGLPFRLSSLTPQQLQYYLSE